MLEINVPMLRFGEFEGEWVEKKLGDYILSHKGGASLKPKDFVKMSNSEVIPKKAVANHGKLFLDKVNPTFCSDEFFNKNDKSVVDNRYLITTLRDLVPSGPNIGYIVKNDFTKSFILAQGVYGLEISKDLDKNFLVLLSNRISYRRIMQKIMVGSTQVHIRNQDFFGVILAFPKLAEQQKIANFLTSTDKKIEQLTQKKSLLESYKKGVMQKIFSQEIRFKRDDGEVFGDWVEKKLGEVLTIGSGKDYKHLGTGDIPVYGTGGYMLSVDKFLYDGESVCIGRKGTIDKPMYLSGKFWTVDTLFYTHSFNNSIPKFIHFVFQRINWKKYNEASGVPSLSKTTISSIKINVPTLAEQTKIANFLSSIDQKVTQSTQEIEAMKSFKKGLLQQMFV